MHPAEELPHTIDSECLLDDLLSDPSEAAVRALRSLPGDVVVLGAGGKMGPTLTRMLLRADEISGSRRRVFAVSRFGNEALRERLTAWGAETISGDLLDESFVAELPPADHVFFLVGRKFGSTGDENLTWANNVYLPAMVCRHYAHSRIVALSTGNVYGLTPADERGSTETDELRPRGEYAMSCLGRERIFEYFARQRKIPTSIVRLNYASELRYGVLADMARQVRDGQPVSLAMPFVNVIWQGDANAMIVAALADASPVPFYVNVAGAERISVRKVTLQLAKRMGCSATFSGSPGHDALLSDSSVAIARYGAPRVGVEQMVAWVADWVARDKGSLGKPTHFEVRDGLY